MSRNPYLLAADNPAALLALLHEHPSLADGQDEHGYSLVHAAASYNHYDLLRTLIRDFDVPVDLKDEDGETALFVVETVEAARILVVELGLDSKIRNDEGQTALEKIEAEGDFPDVVEYLQNWDEKPPTSNGANGINGTVAQEQNGVSASSSAEAADLPPVPEGLQVTMGTMNEAEVEGGPQPDPEFRRRIEELAAREDFQTPEGQAELRRLVEEAVSGESFSGERSVRPRQD
ncbi:uncharacterized protein C8A04DRAFT_10124 [Dichotomopilus funicola]|uniref:Ankyrin repeat protein n=1 Tax=Dichotomopilus funicola TaxID=1934379 RepID=A0AAN6V7A1_9PEZI|nr:hypothetical protein C8A04DRAFT_10124 [Dichotomopilus funicola]